MEDKAPQPQPLAAQDEWAALENQMAERPESTEGAKALAAFLEKLKSK